MLFDNAFMVNTGWLDITSEKAGLYKAGDVLRIKGNSQDNCWHPMFVVLGRYDNKLVGYSIKKKVSYWVSISSNNRNYSTLEHATISEKEKKKLIKEAKEEIQNKLDGEIIKNV